MKAIHSQLQAGNGDAVALKSVHVSGVLEGLLLRVKVRQSYRNDTPDTLEAVYAFPLAWGATLLGLNVELGSKRLNGTVLEKCDATARYEQAIESGDLPVMVERTPSGLFTANLGNLKPAESVVIEVEYAQLLRFEQGRVRLGIPTTIAPRYGDAQALGQLESHQSAEASTLVEYPFTLEIAAHGQMAKAKITCASHKVSLNSQDESVVVRLDAGGRLDRDFALCFEELAGQSFVTVAPDGEQHAVLASFCPDLTERPANPLRMKVLVDCSGSMEGDSIHQARAALHEIAAQLETADLISYSKFGHATHRVIPRMESCSPFLVGQVLAKAIYHTEADMGGTELKAALEDTFAIASPLPETEADILLITDGDVWDIDSIVKTARQHGHRIFAVGVGSAPAESLLRDLAEQTGGACELVSPGEDVRNAVLRMFQRMRTGRSTRLSMDWGQAPIWQSALPRQLCDGETVHVFARFARRPEAAPRLQWTIDGTARQANAERLDSVNDATLARLGGSRQLDLTIDKEQALALALRYELVSQYTNLFLVHERTENDKTTGLPTLQQIPQMHAAGHSGFGSIQFSMARSTPAPVKAGGATSSPRVWHTNRTRVDVDSLRGVQEDHFEVPAFLRKAANEDADPGPAKGVTQTVRPRQLLNEFNRLALAHKTLDDALATLTHLELPDSVRDVLEQICKANGSRRHPEVVAWAFLLQWVGDQMGQPEALQRHALRLVRAVLSGLDEGAKKDARDVLEKTLAGVDSETWTVPAGMLNPV